MKNWSGVRKTWVRGLGYGYAVGGFYHGWHYSRVRTYGSDDEDCEKVAVDEDNRRGVGFAGGFRRAPAAGLFSFVHQASASKPSWSIPSEPLRGIEIFHIERWIVMLPMCFLPVFFGAMSTFKRKRHLKGARSFFFVVLFTDLILQPCVLSFFIFSLHGEHYRCNTALVRLT